LADGIRGDSIVGSYKDSSDVWCGFVYTICEPATLVLLGVGGMMMRKRI
jgi:hypothetical protein